MTAPRDGGIGHLPGLRLWLRRSPGAGQRRPHRGYHSALPLGRDWFGDGSVPASTSRSRQARCLRRSHGRRRGCPRRGRRPDPRVSRARPEHRGAARGAGDRRPLRARSTRPPRDRRRRVARGPAPRTRRGDAGRAPQPGGRRALLGGGSGGRLPAVLFAVRRRRQEPTCPRAGPGDRDLGECRQRPRAARYARRRSHSILPTKSTRCPSCGRPRSATPDGVVLRTRGSRRGRRAAHAGALRGDRARRRAGRGGSAIRSAPRGSSRSPRR